MGHLVGSRVQASDPGCSPYQLGHRQSQAALVSGEEVSVFELVIVCKSTCGLCVAGSLTLCVCVPCVSRPA